MEIRQKRMLGPGVLLSSGHVSRGDQEERKKKKEEEKKAMMLRRRKNTPYFFSIPGLLPRLVDRRRSRILSQTLPEEESRHYSLGSGYCITTVLLFLYGIVKRDMSSHTHTPLSDFRASSSLSRGVGLALALMVSGLGCCCLRAKQTDV